MTWDRYVPENPPFCFPKLGEMSAKSRQKGLKKTIKKRIIMKKTSIITLTVILLSFISHLNGQPLTQTIRGVIIDKDTKITLPGANVVVLNTNPLLGGSTGVDGKFKIENVPVGRHDVMVTFLGYEDIIIPNIIVGSGKEPVITVELTEKLITMKEVEINGNGHKSEIMNKMASVSARSFTVEETKRYAGSFNDPARMAMNYAGVAPNVTGNNDLIIRGNSPMGLLWQLEGVEIPNPNHFGGEGATGGPISILNSTMLTNSDFFTGAFPAEYGNAFSGVFDIRMRNGNNEKREYSIQAGLLGIDVAAEGPFAKSSNGSYLVNYRYSTLAMLNGLGIKVVGDAVPKFQDISFKINIPTKRSGIFTLFGIGGLSQISFEDETEEGNVYSKADVDRDMIAVGLSNTYSFSDKTYLKSILTYSGLRNLYTENTNIGKTSFYLCDKDRFYKERIGASFTLNHKINSQHFLKAGFIGSRINYSMLSDMWDESEEALVSELNDKGDSYLIQSFVNWKYRITEDLSMNSGVHYIYYTLNGKSSIEPRLGMRWQFNKKQALSAGFGMHSRVESLATYLANVEDDMGNLYQYNKDMDFLKALHFVLGYDNRLNENLYIKTEIYYQHLYDVPVEDVPEGVYSILNQSEWFTRKDLSNNGKGYNYGVELSLEKYFSNSYYFMVTGSLFESKYLPEDGKWRNTTFNGNYVFNILGGKEFPVGDPSKNRTLTVSAKGTWAGGHWYTPIDLEESREKQYTVPDENRYLEVQAKDFLKLDLKVSLRRERPKSTHVVEMDIQNITNSMNPAGVYYDRAMDREETWTSMGIIPTLNYRIEF